MLPISFPCPGRSELIICDFHRNTSYSVFYVNRNYCIPQINCKAHFRFYRPDIKCLVYADLFSIDTKSKYFPAKLAQ